MRSGGRTVYIMIIDIVGTWAVGVPLGLSEGLGLHLAAVWVYFITAQEGLVRLRMTVWVFRRRKWMQRLSKEGA